MRATTKDKKFLNINNLFLYKLFEILFSYVKINYQMKNKIIIVGLNYEFCKSVANQLADDGGAFFLDVEDYLSYSLFDRNAMKEKCGIEYLIKQEQKAIKDCFEFENAVINFPYEYFCTEEIYLLFKQNSIVIYLKHSKQTLEKLNQNESPSNTICYNERNKTLSQISDFIISVGNKKQSTIVKEIIDHIVGE